MIYSPTHLIEILKIIITLPLIVKPGRGIPSVIEVIISDHTRHFCYYVP